MMPSLGPSCHRHILHNHSQILRSSSKVILIPSTQPEHTGYDTTLLPNVRHRWRQNNLKVGNEVAAELHHEPMISDLRL